ncbi:unnamed protein product [Ascophyllum nodosum]
MEAGDRPDTSPAVSKTLPMRRASVLEAPPVAPQTFSTVPGHNSEEQGKSKCCGPFYWISAFLGWVVWVFSVSAVADGAWMEGSTREYGVDSRVFEETCSNSLGNIYLATACIAYEYFTVCQRFSTFSCSVAVLLYTISFFRPAEAPHGSAQALGLVGGIFMTIAAFFQMLACLFADETITEVNEFMQLGDNDGDEVLTRGPTYGVGIIALLLGVINAIVVFVSYRHGGDGPIFPRIKARDARTALRPVPFVESFTSDPRSAYGSTAASVV